MKLKKVIFLLLFGLLLLVLPGCGQGEAFSATSPDSREIVLPEPMHDSDTSLEQALSNRRSVRSFSEEPLTLQQLGQLLWAGQGITDPSGKRTSPSAGALYPLTLYVVIGNVEGVAAGVYKYSPENHTLTRVLDGDKRQALAQAALGQSSVRQGAVDIVITAIYEITTAKYGERGVMFVHLEAGHAAQNVCLEAVVLDLGTVTVGAFDDAGVQQALELPENEVPLYIIPAGNRLD
jgi:SagB-type dehydrogenase family enzyme